MFVAGDSAAVCGRLRGFVSLIYIMPRRHYHIEQAQLEQFRAFRLRRQRPGTQYSDHHACGGSGHRCPDDEPGSSHVIQHSRLPLAGVVLRI